MSTGGVVRNTKATKVRYKGLLDCLYSIARNEGVPGLYKGLTPSLLLVSHGAIQFTCYENLKSIARGGVSVAPDDDTKGDDNDTAPSMEQRELTSTECAVYGRRFSKILLLSSRTRNKSFALECKSSKSKNETRLNIKVYSSRSGRYREEKVFLACTKAWSRISPGCYRPRGDFFHVRVRQPNVSRRCRRPRRRKRDVTFLKPSKKTHAPQ